jgi:hypothetical protein
MNHISELTTELSTLYEGLKNGTIEVKTAAEMNNTAGKIIHAQRVQLEYAVLRKEQPEIAFMKTEAKAKIEAEGEVEA